MRLFGIMMILAFGLTVVSIASADDTKETESSHSTASTKSRDPASTGAEMSRESEDALKGAVSRVNQLMDTASKSAPATTPAQTDE